MARTSARKPGVLHRGALLPVRDGLSVGPMPCGSATGEANAILRFDPKTERFESFPLTDSYASVRQLAGRKRRGLGGRILGRQALHDQK